MCKTYTLEDNDGLMAELKSMHGKMAEMRGRLERDEITPDECMFRCIAMGRRHSSHAARALLACYQRDARIISLFPRTMAKGKKRRPDSVNRANYKPK